MEAELGRVPLYLYLIRILSGYNITSYEPFLSHYVMNRTMGK